MKLQSILLAAAIALCAAQAAFALEISASDAARIGHKVWQNECDGTVEGLVSWNPGEAFPSLGIGHFIWYAAGKRGPFEESFPELIALFKKQSIPLPEWVCGPSPWKTSAEMNRDTARVHQLRALLSKTITLQTAFLVHRLESALPKMLAATKEKAEVKARFNRIGATPAGTFALIDYVNFKGEGVLSTERYDGQGWGLLQVLEGMKDGSDAVRDFSDSAKRVLARRVKNAPPSHHEERWLPGWQARVGRYAEKQA